MTSSKLLNPAELFSAVIGQIAFSIKPSHGSCFFIEFGEPSLRIREPIEPSRETSERVRTHLGRRQVTVVGAWSLLVLGCDWSLTNEHRSADQHDAVEKMEELFRSVEGQYLVSACIEEATKSCTLKFDMGATLVLRPRHDWNSRNEPDENQWQLHSRDGSTVCYTNQGFITAFEATDEPGKRER